MSDAVSIPIVALGASAGGVEALEQFFRALDGRAGLAFVVLTHLDAHRESRLGEILRSQVQFPVVSAQDGMRVEADHVYVLQPGTILTVAQGVLRARRIDAPHRETHPIDVFFSSLAADRGERAIGIVLSGTGGDGTLGLKAIKERGGITLAQGSNRSAPHHGPMPDSAVAAGVVDLVLPVEDMPARLRDLVRPLRALDTFADIEQDSSAAIEETRRTICQILQARTGHDFSGYKPSTFLRRVNRRRQMLELSDLTLYVARLRETPEEASCLFRDLLIGVTGFFRDRNAFEALEKKVIPRLFENKGPGDTLRVWVPGCATGEEVYSLAILLREHMQSLLHVPQVQVFATDIDSAALRVARAGCYPAVLLEDIAPERLRRFFIEDQGVYSVSHEIRDLCIFSAHSVIRDPPFSRLDLVSCRNLLIYLGAGLQEQVLPIFHYALRPGGFLFLGTAESVTQHAELFVPIDKKHRIFQRRERDGAPYLPLARLSLAVPRLPADPAVNAIGPRRSAELRVLERFAPAHVVVNAEGELLYLSPGTGKYLELPSGPPTRHLVPMARPGLRLDLRTALQEAVQTRRTVSREPLAIEGEGGRLELSLTVEPLQSGGAETLFLVVFKDLPAMPAGGHEVSAASDPGTREAFERELRDLHERLQVTIEEYETSTEELKSANEELLSLNEELQAANEELQTSKEELQSINEELHTVNMELASKIEQLDRANSDLRNLFESTRIPSVFLDKDLLVRSFTPAASEIFHLIPSDRGRPLTDIATRLQSETIGADCRAVLGSRQPIERHVSRREDGAHYLMRVQPYLSSDDVVDGVTLSFVDITALAVAEERQRQLLSQIEAERARLRALLEQIPVGVLLAEAPSGRLVFASAAVERVFGPDWPRSECVAAYAEWGAQRADGTLYAPEATPLARALRGEEVRGEEMRFLRPDGSRIILGVNAAPVYDADGRIVSAVLAFEDITADTHAAERQELLLAELNHRVKNMLAVVIAVALETLARSRKPEDFRTTFIGRIEAMAKTYGLLTRDEWGDVVLSELVREEVAPYAGQDGRRLHIEGPPVLLRPKAALALGMVLHELATNAVKYGALSVPQGQVTVSWTFAPQERQLVLTWCERDGPEVHPPTERGFGSNLIEQTLSYELDGQAMLDYQPSGVRARLAIPLASGTVILAAGQARESGR